jgi:hypothetical protein
MIDGNALTPLLGRGASDPRLVKTLRAMKLKNFRPDNFDKSYDSSLVWMPKQALRTEYFRLSKYMALTGLEPLSEGEWILGGASFMAAGYDDRIKSDFEGTLAEGLPWSASPEAYVATLGEPQLTEYLDRYDTHVLAWVKGDHNISIQFRGSEKRMYCFSRYVRGTVGAWAFTWPDVFAAPTAGQRYSAE